MTPDLSHDVRLAASVAVLLRIALVAGGAVRHLAGCVADRQAGLEVDSQLSQALKNKK